MHICVLFRLFLANAAYVPVQDIAQQYTSATVRAIVI